MSGTVRRDPYGLAAIPDSELIFELHARGHVVLTPSVLDKLAEWLVFGADAQSAQLGQIEYSRVHGMLQSRVSIGRLDAEIMNVHLQGRDNWAEPESWRKSLANLAEQAPDVGPTG